MICSGPPRPETQTKCSSLWVNASDRSNGGNPQEAKNAETNTLVRWPHLSPVWTPLPRQGIPTLAFNKLRRGFHSLGENTGRCFLSWAGERQEEKEGESQEDKRRCSGPWTDFCCAPLADLPPSHSGHFLSKIRLNNTCICFECFHPGLVDSLANVSLAARRPRCGCGWWDANPSLPLGKQVKRQGLL